MSLESMKDAVQEVIQEMMAEAEDLKGKPTDAAASFMCNTLKGYAKQLKVICKAAGEDKPQPGPATIPGLVGGSDPSLMFLSPLAQHAKEVDKYRKEFRKKNGGAEDTEERYEGEFVTVSGGPADGTTYNIDPAMPTDGSAHMDLIGAVYTLLLEDAPDGTRKIKRLVYDEARTDARRRAATGSGLIIVGQ